VESRRNSPSVWLKASIYYQNSHRQTKRKEGEKKRIRRSERIEWEEKRFEGTEK